MGALLRSTLFLLPILLGAEVVEPAVLFGLLGNPFPSSIPAAGRRGSAAKPERGPEGCQEARLRDAVRRRMEACEGECRGVSDAPRHQERMTRPSCPTIALDCWAHAVEFDIDTGRLGYFSQRILPDGSFIVSLPHLDPELNIHKPSINTDVLPAEGMQYGRSLTTIIMTELVERDDLMANKCGQRLTMHG